MQTQSSLEEIKILINDLRITVGEIREDETNVEPKHKDGDRGMSSLDFW